MEMNGSDFASIYFGSIIPLHFNASLDYEAFQRLNATVHSMIKNGSLLNIFQRNNDTDENDRDSLYLLIPITAVYVVICIACVIGNVSTCIVIVRNKCMHTATNYYLFSLAISDLLLLLSGLPQEITRIWYPDVYLFGETTCRLLGLSSEMSTNATVLTITAFTVERYIAICHPFLSHTMSKLSRVVKFIIAIWVVGFCLALPQVLQFGLLHEIENGRVRTTCTVKWEIVEHAFVISSFVFFVGPMTLITVLYVLIGLKLRSSRLLGSAKKNSVHNNTDQNGGAVSYKNHVSQSRAIKMLVAVAVSFFICWAPFHAQRLLAAILLKTQDLPDYYIYQVYIILNYISGVLYFLSTTINPFLYNIMSNKFREAFKNTIAHRCCCHRPKVAVKSKTSGRYQENYKMRRSKTLSARTKLSYVNSVTIKEGNNNSKRNKLRCSFGGVEVKKSLQPKDCVNKYETSFSEKIFKISPFKAKNEDSSSLNETSSKMLRNESTESAKSHSISNSSLQDLDEEEFTGKELAIYMEQINNNIA